MRKAKRRSRLDFFSEGEFCRFLAACPPWLAAFAEFGSLTALRPGEIRRLERGNLVPHAGIWNGSEELGLIRLRADQTKSRSEETVLLLPRAREIAETQPTGRHPNVFLGPNGRTISRHSLRHHFEMARRAAGLRVARPHMLRHTAASWLVQRGVPLSLVQHILRHKSYRTTEGYAHVLPVHLAGAMVTLGAAGRDPAHP